MLGPHGRGELAAITLWPMAFVFIFSFGLNQAIVYHTGKKSYTASQIWTATCLVGVAQSVLVLGIGALLMPLLLHKYPADTRSLGLLFLFCAPALMFSGYPGNVFQGQNDLFRFNLLRMISPAIYAAGLVVLALLHKPSLKLILSIQGSAYLAALALGIVILYRTQHPTRSWDREAASGLLSYGVRTHLSNLTSYFNQRADQLVLSLLIPAQQLGLYAVAVTIAMGVSFFPVAAGMVTFSRGSGQSEADLRNTIVRSFRMSLVWLLLGCSGLFFTAPYLISILLGPRFEGSILACRLLLPGMVALGLNQVLYNGANAMGKPALPSYAEASGLIITTSGLLLFVARFGFIGAAVVSTIAYITSLVVMLALARQRMNINPTELLFGNGPQPAAGARMVGA